MLSPELQDELRAIGRARRYRRGQRLVREGERLGAVVVLHTGLVKVVASSIDGDEHILALRGPGEIIGDLSVICDSTASATVEVLEDTDATVVASSAYLEFLRVHPDFMLGQMRRVIEVLRQSDAKRLELATVDLSGRVARGLLETSRTTGVSGVHDVPVSQEELAHLCGASREAVARVLRTFRDRGWIHTERRRVVVHDREALESASRDAYSPLDSNP